MSLEDFYNAIGGDYQKMITNFKSDQKILKYVNMFSKDESFESLKNNINDNNYQNAYVACHTLKGVSGNLAFSNLFNSSSILVEELRNNSSVDVDKVSKLFTQVKSDYSLIIDKINELNNK